MSDIWKEAKDNNGRVYYYNSKTGESRWEKPVEAPSKQEQLLKKNGWSIGKSKAGKIYYYNTKTGESSWELPKFDEVKIIDKEPVKIEEKRIVETTDNKSGTEIAVDSNFINKSKILHAPKKSKEDAEKFFMEMLKENSVDATWSFSKIISELGSTDPRYWLVDDDPIWKQQTFEKYLSNRTEDQLLQEHIEINKFQKAFIDMLKDKKEIHYYTRWSTAKRLIGNEPIYKHSTVNESVKKATFFEYIGGLRQEKDQEDQKLKDQALRELREYLKSIVFQDTNSTSNLRLPLTWQQLLNSYLFEKSKRYMANKHFNILTQEDVLKEYLEIIKSVELNFVDKLKEIDAKNYTQDRIARDGFKKLLNDEKLIKIRANSKWSDLYPSFKNDERYLNTLGRKGSSALDLFYSMVEEKKSSIMAQKSIAQQVLIENGYEWPKGIEQLDSCRANIMVLLRDDSRFSKVDEEDIDLIADELIKSRKDKVQQEIEVEKRILEQKKNYFKIMLNKVYANDEKIMSEPWELVKPKICNTYGV
ncbi:hypothetical protein Kpol_1073p4 [Vanderwaltozyma polyspora DSM 70294]|uniref:Pre-mRNA-processing protein PRP40 n=1 Tax=Vanderwaltozyma polyspora (strain ATCC 22028 / DSM 70294 / BCRC 21397 / CBS 2163 / NBRC 10782 / NRRL Y-8283 / UCD 57-17) TaxID=436907 RepID=A7TPR7_VANPO|nr:uncharacterized protein Kpol_1073p4 [Vanderwaltozyma polyspora DSM 70294]EDO15718.1 hypothetical protein Kpol_1073p4 [Vanderwaltozyma polyspora DSM 70294]